MKKKEEYQKGTHRASLLADMKEKKMVETTVDEKLEQTTSLEGLSFGQSSGLKDDLDVDDNDIGEKKRLAFLDLLLESSQNGVVISDEEVREQVDTIMFEGHDTTAAGSSFFLSMMGVHKEIQEKIIEEMDRIFGDSDRPATFADTLEMKFLERCLLETLRLYPPVPLIARQVRQDLKLGKLICSILLLITITYYFFSLFSVSLDATLPAGCTIGIATVAIHRRADIYPNPLVFDPDNFLPERMANRHYYAFIPFSAGPRSCVGKKMQIHPPFQLFIKILFQVANMLC